MRPKTYLMSFCLFILYVDVRSCSTSSSRPAAAKFHADTNNNGIWWPAEEEDVSKNSGSNHDGDRHHHQPYSQENEHEKEKHSYKLPETSNETGMNGQSTSTSSGSKRTNNNSDNNEEQPQIIASREPHQSESYYRGEDESGSGTSDGSSKDLIEKSSIISSSTTVSEPTTSMSTSLSNHNLNHHQLLKQSNGRRLMAKSTQGLGLVHFTNKSITCNDGTPAGYYIRKSHLKGPDENLWIIFLEGGWYCFDQRSCMTRWHRLKHLMSSEGWPSIKHGGGILSSDPSENPYWWNANHIFVPYCSSDTWSGRVRGNENGNPFSFMGALIVDEVIKSLINNEGLNSDSSVILAGSSAGGTGVMINVDHVETLLTQEFGSPHGMQRVKGITDSGWFIDKVPLYTEKANCNDVILCPPEISLRKGMNLWQARLPQACRDSHPDDPWSCFFGYRIYPTLKASLFVFQWLFDEAQMVINNVPTPALRKEEWDYVYRIGDELKKTLVNVSNVFIPSCLAHTVLTNRDWRKVAVNSIELTRALKCWESGGIIEESNFIPKKKSPPKYWEDYELDSSLHSSGPRGVFRHGKLYSSTTAPSPSINNNRSLSPPDNSNSNNFDSTVISNSSSRRNRRRHNRHRHNKQSSSSGNSHNHRQNRRRRKKLEKRQKLQQQQQNRNANAKPKKKEQRQRSVDKLQEHHLTASAKNSGINFDSIATTEITSLERVKSRNHHNKNKQKKKKRNRRWYSVCDGISNRLIEKCSWPQCGRTCPKLLNPLTGEEVDFKDLLKSFGLDLATMAKALGIDLATLNSMDHQVLLQMLTQHA